VEMDQTLKIEQTLERIRVIIAKRTELKRINEKSELEQVSKNRTGGHYQFNCTKCGGTTWILIEGKARRCRCFGNKNS